MEELDWGFDMKLPKEIFNYYTMMMRCSDQAHRGQLIDMFGTVLWQEDYDAWQLRIKEIAPERVSTAYTCDSPDGCHCGGDTARVRAGCYYFKDAAIHVAIP